MKRSGDEPRREQAKNFVEAIALMFSWKGADYAAWTDDGRHGQGSDSGARVWEARSEKAPRGPRICDGLENHRRAVA